tara:strand:+ start:16 stop:1350 length:1335 start_codon:yes stop_codon:yes gene_type:complete
MGIQINGNTDNIGATDGSLSIEDIQEVNATGVITATNFKTGVSNLHSVGLTLTGGQVDVGSNIKIGTAGVVTATSFVGSGANLTSLPAANLTGTAAAINGSNITNLNASNIASGTVPTARLGSGTASSSTFLAGDSTFKTVTGTTINNNADNRVITGSGTANTLEGESTFTHDSTNYDTVISGSANAPMDLIIRNDHNSFTGAGARLTIQSGNEANTGPQEQMIVGSHSWLRQVPKSSGNMTLAKNGTTHTTFAATGDLTIGDGDLVVASGHGIDFSATSDATHTGASGANPSTDSEVLTDYEHGTWTPRLRAYDHTGGAGWGTMKYTDGTDVIGTGRYVRMGNHVWCGFKFESGSKVFDSNWTYWSIDNTPYGANHYDKASGSLYVNQTNFFTDSNSHIGGFVHGNESYMVVNKPNGHSNASINTSNNNRYCYGHISIYTSRT